MLEIVFLGTGSSIPSKRRNLSSVWLSYSDSCMLFDCGEGTQRQLLYAGLNFMKIDHIFITHWHADHWAGLIGLMQTMNMEKRKRPLHIYGPEAERFVGDLLDLDYWGPGFQVQAHNIPYEGHEISVAVDEPEFQVLSVPSRHSVPSVAYAFKEKDRVNVDIEKAGLYGIKQGKAVGKLKEQGFLEVKGKKVKLEDVALVKLGVKTVYSGDTAPSENVVDLAKNADLLIHEATMEEDIVKRMHTSPRQAGQVAKKANAKRLLLTHFSRRYSDVAPLVDEAKKEFPEAIAAEDFMHIKLKIDSFSIGKAK